jgi:hypothetical protein
MCRVHSLSLSGSQNNRRDAGRQRNSPFKNNHFIMTKDAADYKTLKHLSSFVKSPFCCDEKRLEQAYAEVTEDHGGTARRKERKRQPRNRQQRQTHADAPGGLKGDDGKDSHTNVAAKRVLGAKCIV